MKKSTLFVALLLLILGQSLRANTAYPPQSYKLSEDGTTLVSWIGEEESIDFSSDTHLAKVQAIGAKAFASNRNVRSVALSPQVTQIGSGAFDDCSSLKSVTGTKNVTTIGNDAFHACKGLSTFDFPQLQSIGNSAFSLCRALTRIELPQSLQKIEYGAFYGCLKLKEIVVEEGNPYFESLSGVLYSHAQQEVILCPQALALTELTLPETVTSIQGRAFDGTTLKSIVLPRSLTRIGKAAFFKAKSLTQVQLLATTPPQLEGTEVFANANLANCTLQVPATALPAYREAEPWKSFAQIEALPTATPSEEITLTTQASVGDYIPLSFEAEGAVDLVGATMKFGGMCEVTAQTIKIKGAVTKIDCSSCNVTQLDLSKSQSLKQLWCTGNSIETLEVAHLSALEILFCGQNALKALDLRGNAQLKELDCSENNLTTLNTIANKKLSILLCYHNSVATTDLSQNPLLVGVDFSENQLTALDLSHNPLLETVYCNGNQIGGEAMRQVIATLPNRMEQAKEGHFFGIDTKNAKEANCIYSKDVATAQTKKWSVLNYSDGDNDGNGLPYAGTLEPVSSSRITLTTDKAIGEYIGLNFRAEGDVTVTGAEYDSPGYYRLTAQTVSLSGKVVKLDCSSNQLTSVDIREAKELEQFLCDDNRLTAIQMAETPKLKLLYCGNNQLKSLDLKGLVGLEDFSCFQNQIAQLDFSRNPLLTSIICRDNQLVGILDLSNNPKVHQLNCYNNQLTAIRLASNNEMQHLECQHNKIAGESMTLLMRSLPKFVPFPADEWDDYMGMNPQGLYLVELLESEGNKALVADVQIAREKGWKVFAMNIENYGVEKPTEYQGIDTSIQSVGNAEYALYPNPCLERLHIDGGNATAEVRIFNSQGQWVEKVHLKGNSIEIDTAHWVRGTYLVEITTPQQTQYYKVIKE